MQVSRRKFLTLAGTSAATVTMLSPLEAFYARVARGEMPTTRGYGRLEEKLPLNSAELPAQYRGVPILQLPRGFNYTAFHFTGEQMDDGFTVPQGHDGMAAYPGANKTTILVCNHELGSSANNPVRGDTRYSTGVQGGTSTVVVGADRKPIKHFNSLAGTSRNCAGGPTPWRTWVTCEETFSTSSNTTGTAGTATVRHGYNFEVVADPNSGLVTPVALTAMGRFNHEAIAVDPRTGYVYETEDRGDSSFYRFVPNVRPTKVGDLAQGGTLYALKVRGAENFALNTINNPNFGGQPGLVQVGQKLPVEWVQIDNPDPDQDTVRKEAQEKGAAIFFRGEGAWYGNGLIYFVASQGGPPVSSATNARGNGQVWAYDPAREELTLVVEGSPTGAFLEAPDNITVAPWGDLFLCEDGSGVDYIVGVNGKGEVYQFAMNNLGSSEFAGACFSADGRTMFVNIQSPGITLAIFGPWNRAYRG
ncbi:alkaline phosphatase PhoX [Umezakia ovalisporum]|uniref:PhoX family protein n=2 Tax=Umezakia ovalisporum TaxID=75695 RepID=A0AA43GWD9_9CYAN|nr:alkaline phosphatase PhoX [Umezakia ovalisporum]MDH6056235.1 PhoX family protein [Umezakia ovalisporum FSS-43]MDH6062931.1 PhoX family protein [Umezakia ovalisporum FSS-62]MDH6067809.1 PhoX family protein [Umezakia ovalisporum APH033B]MDH6070883.1 PhoX family protein [Umezakia ovalisporum CobakiLakeA]MDH6074520.1 PhoX family protein [Umezakia ovalisporum CS-1034]